MSNEPRRGASRVDFGSEKCARIFFTGFAVALAGAGLAAAQGSASVEEPGREVFTLSGQLVDFVGGDFVLRHEGGVVEVNFSGWPERVPDGPGSWALAITSP